METNEEMVGVRVRIDALEDPHHGDIGIIDGIASDEYYSVRIIGRNDLALFNEDELKVVKGK